MSRKITINDKKIVIVEARNIGFMKSAKDFVTGNELEGIEELMEEAVASAKEHVPHGFEVSDIDFAFSNETNLILWLKANKSQ